MAKDYPRTEYISIISQGEGSIRQTQNLIDTAKALQARGHYKSAEKLFDRARDVVGSELYSGVAHGETAEVKVTKGKTSKGHDVTSISAIASTRSKLPPEFIQDYRTTTAMTAKGANKSKDVIDFLAKHEARERTTIVDERKGEGFFGFLKKIVAVTFNLSGQESEEEKARQASYDRQNKMVNAVTDQFEKNSKPVGLSSQTLQNARAESYNARVKELEHASHIHKHVESYGSDGGFFSNLFGGGTKGEIITLVNDEEPPPWRTEE